MPSVFQTLWAEVSETYNFSLVDTNAQMESVSKDFATRGRKFAEKLVNSLPNFSPGQFYHL